MQTEKEYTVGREINGLRCDSVGDYSLPDYNGDVKKVLLVKTRVFPTGKFVGDDTLEFSGSVGYEVVYIDGENNITHADFSTDYEAAVKINSTSYVDSDIKTTVSSCNMRLVGPRKFSVKCALDNDVRISERRSHNVAGDAFMEYDPEYVSQTAKVFTSVFSSGETREINEEILTLEGAIADEVEILLCDIKPDVSITDILDTTAEMKGTLKVGILYKNEDNVLKCVEKEVPYNDELSIEGDGLLENVDVRIDTVNSKAAVTPTEDGVSLGVSLSVVPKVYGKKNSALELITDAYLKERGTENEYTEFGYTEHILSESYEEKFESKYSVSDLEIENINEIMYSDASTRVEECEIEEESVKIHGEIKFSAIACQVNEDGDRTYVPIKFSAPFVQNVNISCQIHDNMRVNASVSVQEANIDFADNSLLASCNLVSNITINSDRRQRCLGASYVTDEEYARDDSVVTVYYPDKAESLFEIAKKFHTSVGAIAENNRLTETVFAASRKPLGTLGVEKLLIK